MVQLNTSSLRQFGAGIGKENIDPNGTTFIDLPEPSGGALSDIEALLSEIDDLSYTTDLDFSIELTDNMVDWINSEYSETDEYLYEDPGDQNNLPELDEKISMESRAFINCAKTKGEMSEFIDMIRGFNFCCTGRRNKLCTLFYPNSNPGPKPSPRRSRPGWTVFNETN